MYSFLSSKMQPQQAVLTEAAIKPASAYSWFVYDGPKLTLDYRGKPFDINRKQKFGVRKSANKKEIRLVLDDVNRVFTITLDQAKKLAKHIQGRK